MSLIVAFATTSVQAANKPNIVFIMGNDIGLYNLSTYHQRMVGFDTPNIDRIAREGGKLMTYYVQQICTAGRSTLITGQLPLRTGLSKVGLPGSDLRIKKADPTLAELLKPLGYTSGQFGKNHLGDKDEFLPTMVQNARNMDMWRTKFEVLRTPLLFDLGVNPFERATDGTF